MLRRLASTQLSRALSTSSERVSVTRHSSGVVQVTLRRGSKLNALDIPMFRAIQATATNLIDDKSVRAVVLHGEGKAFCAGLDVRSVMHPLNAKSNIKTLLNRPDGAVSNLAQDVGYLWRRVPAPVIGALHGVCLGGGLQIALGCDMRVATAACKLSVMEAKWGLIPDMSATVTLPELVPKDVAMELTMTGRVFDGQEALDMGLVTRLVEDPLEEAMRLANEISCRSPDANAAAKRLWHATYSEKMTEDRSLRIESDMQRQLIGGWNQLACAAKGLGVPALLQPAFRERAASWDAEADELAESELLAMLDGPPEEGTESRESSS